ncbi:type III effector HrpK domain-containing protein [Paraburkholderia megapolitana]|uniref:type III effector HrpK domain-containing protein n=1 Tax=Paraburkholderia megapolitana TaxID=420953 RepID=UPI0038BDED93
MNNISITVIPDTSSSMVSGLQSNGQNAPQNGMDANFIAELQNILATLMHKQMQEGVAQPGGNPTNLQQTNPQQTTLPQTTLPQTTLPQGSLSQAPTGSPTQATNSGSGSYPELDNYTAQNDSSDLGKWSDLAASSQGVSLERPLAAMQILSGQPGANGQPPTPAQKQAAMQFVNDNPSMKSAMQNAGALKSDGSIDQKKMKGLMDSVHTNLSQADDNVKAYMKKHPDADAASLNKVRSAGLIQAYNALAGESTGHQGGKNNNNYSGGKNSGGITTKQQVDDLQDNKGFSSALKSAAQAWSSSGAFDALDRAGDDKATSKADGKVSDDNLSDFIKNDAPSTAQGNQSFLEDASLQNITANTDTSNLNQDIFANPQNYTPQQKAAVMVKLMQTLVNVQAGGSDGLRDVSKTVAALTQDIQQLASDPATQAYLQQAVPPAMQNLDGEFAQAGGLSEAGDSSGGGSGGGSAVDGSGSQSQGSASNVVDQVHKGLSDAKTVTQSLSDLAKGEGFMGIGGDSAAAEAAGAAGAAGGAEGAEGAVAGVDAAVAGAEGGTAAAEGVMGAVAGGLAAAAPVLAIGAGIAGIAGIVMAIVQAVQKKQHQNEFADNVDPTLKQFGIPLPS